jgi:hypothetical protein
VPTNRAGGFRQGRIIAFPAPLPRTHLRFPEGWNRLPSDAARAHSPLESTVAQTQAAHRGSLIWSLEVLAMEHAAKPQLAGETARPAAERVPHDGERETFAGNGPADVAQRALKETVERSPRLIAQRAMIDAIRQGSPPVAQCRPDEAATSPADGVVQRFKVRNTTYHRVEGGSIAQQAAVKFGVESDIPEASEPGLPAFVPNVPTKDTVNHVATRYMEGWGDKEAARRRQRLVIGVNTWQSFSETTGTALARARAKAEVEVPDGAVGTALVFVWQPRWRKNNQQGAFWPEAAVDLTEGEKVDESKEAVLRGKIPYGLFRSFILSHQSTSEYAQAFAGKGYLPYVHVADPDSPSFKVPQGRQTPGGDKAFLSGSFAEQSDVGLFDRITALINRRRTRVRPDKAPKTAPSVLSGGYQIRASSSAKTIPLSIVGTQIDMQTRRVLFSKGVSATAAYLPEPNLFVNWDDLPKVRETSLARDGMFGTGSGESEELMKGLIEELRKRGRTDEEIRERVAFKPAAAVATGASGEGQRFLAKTEQGDALAVPADLKDAYVSLLQAEQNHANPNKWRRMAVEAIFASGAAIADKTHLEDLVLSYLKTSAGTGGPLERAISQLAPARPATVPVPVVPDGVDGKLRAMAAAMAQTLLAYEPTLTELIRPKEAGQ